MRIGGAYVGLGEGDISDEVDKIKDFVRRKWDRFDATVGDGPVFTPELAAVIVELQAIYVHDGKLRADEVPVRGVINKRTKEAMGYLPVGPPPETRPILLTVCGTAVPWWVGPDADVARAVESKLRWRPVGYRAAAFPMGKSIDEGLAEAVRICEEERGAIEAFGIVLAGYSQGAYIVSLLWQKHINPTGGRLNWMKKHVRKAVLWGNPKRQVGKNHPDPGAEMAADNTGGVDEELMTDTPDWWWEFSHAGDLYSAARDDESRENKVAIWKVIRGSKVFSGPDSLLMQVLEVLGIKRDASQISEVVGIFRALLDAGMFFGKGLTPHTNYNVGPAIEYLRAP